MPIVYIHGVAIRNRVEKTRKSWSNQLLERLVQDVTWEMVEPHLRHFIAPEMAADAQQVSIRQAYWGDLAAKLAWEGDSYLPEVVPTSRLARWLPFPFLSHPRILTELRQPLNQLGARLLGDVFCYLNSRGDATKPGPIPQRILGALALAQEVKEETGEPIVVLTNSMGGQIMYDIVTHFLPGLPEFANLHVDFWCSVAAQIGLFEELKLFIASSDEYSKARGNRVPFPDRRHLGIWWNVWDTEDIISYSVRDIIEGVDDMPFHVGQSLLKEHVGYLQEESFYRLFAERLRRAIPIPRERLHYDNHRLCPE